MEGKLCRNITHVDETKEKYEKEQKFKNKSDSMFLKQNGRRKNKVLKKILIKEMQIKEEIEEKYENNEQLKATESKGKIRLF